MVIAIEHHLRSPASIASIASCGHQHVHYEL